MTYGSAQFPLLRDALKPGHVTYAPNRVADVTDTFADYTRHENCTISSLELHDPFHPLCSTKQDLLNAASGGGRSGMNKPYIPRDCDMRWFTHAEICEVLSRFSGVTVAGDSMMRNLAIAMHVFLRKDLKTGSHQNWIPEGADGADCACSDPFEHWQCVPFGAYSTAAIRQHDPESLWCPGEDAAPIECRSNGSVH